MLVASQPLPLIPYPNEIAYLGGNWTLAKDAAIGYDSAVAGAKTVADKFAEQLRKCTGYKLPVSTHKPTSGVYFGGSEAVTQDGEYTITMSTTVAEIRGKTELSLFYGLQTFLQMLPSEVLMETAVSSVAWTTPIVAIHDAPRFAWRGLMIDVARHFQSVENVKKILDGMVRYKLNMLHIHLTDDQGWRIESKKFPNLTEIGSIRAASPKHWDRNTLDNIPYGPFFYTQEEIKELLAYAKERHITIVPEIEMPGHAICALSAFPQLSCTGGPFQPRCYWGIDSDVYCPGNDATFEFLEALLDEMMELFDSPYIHIGGDECPKTRWKWCSKCKARMAEQGLSNYDQLQAWFTAHFAQYLASKGRKLIGWDEIVQGGLPDGTTVMAWTSAARGTEAAKTGHDVVMALTDALYFDYPQFTATDEYEYIGSQVSSLHNVYEFEPTKGIDEEYKQYIIGVQAQAWGEYIWELNDLEYKVFPRLAALAEIGWTNTAQKDWNRFLTSVDRYELDRLKLVHVNAAPLSIGLVAKWDSGELPTQWTNMQWHVTGSIDDAGHYEIAFIWRGGTNALKIKNVQVWIAGLPSGSDDHQGIAFSESANNIYHVHTLIPATISKITISADVCCDGGSDSFGDVIIYHV